MYINGSPIVPCPPTLAEAAERARHDAAATPGAVVRIERDGALAAEYVIKKGRLVPWVK